MRVFIVRPFGRKQEIDFDRVQRELIDPASAQLAVAETATTNILEAGGISADVLESLLLADVVIADTSIDSGNVFYALDIRVAFRAKRTLLISARGLSSIPVDLRTERFVEYDPGQPAGSVTLLQRALREIAETLPGHSDPVPVPLEFVQEINSAKNNGQIGRLALLAWEAQGFSWESAAGRIVHRALGLLARNGLPSFQRAIVFTGHMIDAPGRQKPRFPNEKAPLAAAAIDEAVREISRGEPKACIGFAGGASGGDLLFHEACARQDIVSRLRLSLPVRQFLATSVAPGDADWVPRFHAIAGRLRDVTEILQSSEDLAPWLRDKKDYNVWGRTNVWLLEDALASGAPEVHLLALWNGEAGDGPGGTAHLIELARQRNVNTHILDTKILFRTG
jgi:hypothetical protein